MFFQLSVYRADLHWGCEGSKASVCQAKGEARKKQKKVFGVFWGLLDYFPWEFHFTHTIHTHTHTHTHTIYIYIKCMSAKSLQSCPTLCDPVDHSPPGSSLHGILQARILEWVAMPSSSKGPSHPGIEPASLASPALQAGSLPLLHLAAPDLSCGTWLILCG